MTGPQHPDREELMAWADGELQSDAAAAMQSHVAICQMCQALMSDLRVVNSRLQSWAVETAPPTLRIPTPAPAGWARRLPRWVWLSAPVAAVVVMFAVVRSRPTDLARPMAATPAASQFRDGMRPAGALGGQGGRQGQSGQDVAIPEAATASRSQPLIARVASIQIVVDSLEDARRALERYLAASGGAIVSMSVTENPAASRTLTAVVSVSPAALEASLQAMRALGRVEVESQGSEDVTAEAMDLDARLASARQTEARLQTLLANRTANLSDVLEVEREAARVRETIERMEAARKHLAARVATARITLTIRVERRAAIAPAANPVVRDLSNAFRDGVRGAAEFLLAVAMFALRVAPTAAICGLAASLLLVWRRRRRTHIGSRSA